MLYGGPLGTYLSGISTASSVNHPSSSSTGYLPSAYASSNYLGGGLRRVTSRYRPNGALGSGSPSVNQSVTSNTAGTNSPSLSPYYSSPVRRKYTSSENESKSLTTGRYHSRVPTRSAPVPSTSVSSINSTPSSSSSSVSDHSSSTSSHYLRRSPSKSGSTSYSAQTLRNSPSWNSELNTASGDSVDYKRLYEAEKMATEELRAEIASAQKETRNLQEQIDSALRTRRSSTTEQRKLERRISECEEELKLLEKLRAESEKLRAEHRALVRVVSRLNREQ